MSVNRIHHAIVFILTAFLVFSSTTSAQEIDLDLPAPSKIKAISKPFNPAVIRAITVDPQDPFLFDFIIDRGDTNLDAAAFEAETQKLVKYFLAALTIPEADLWVNLSPYEQDAMISPVLGVTELGKDLLIRDYYLKQVTAQLTNPNTPTGKKFWDLAYKKAQELYGTTSIPINTFSKVWIVPDQATVLEKDGSAFIADSHLKVFLDQDYFAVKKNVDNKEIGTDKLGTQKTEDINNFSAQLIREVVLPEIEKEVNFGENFAAIRQIYSAAILATWYKASLKESLLGKLYADQNKVAGVNADDMDAGEKIFEKYTAALKTGAYNMIRQDYDLSSQKIVQRKYFSGGGDFRGLSASTAIRQMTATSTEQLSPAASSAVSAVVDSMKVASLGGGTVDRYSRVRVAVNPAARGNVALVSERLTSRGGGYTDFGTVGKIDFGFDQPVVTTRSTNLAPNYDITAVESLGNLSSAEVDALAARNGLDSRPVRTLYQKIVDAKKRVASAEYRQIFRNLVSQARRVLTPTARQSFAQAKDPDWQVIKTLRSLGDANDQEFEAVTKNISTEQKDDLVYVRNKVKSLTGGRTVVNLIAENDARINRVLISPVLSDSIGNPDRPVLSESARKDVAVIFAKKQDFNVGVALRGMGYEREKVAELMDPKNQEQLIELVQNTADTFLSAANIDPVAAVALQKIVNPYGDITNTQSEYNEESNSLYSDLVKQGFNKDIIDEVVKVREAMRPKAAVVNFGRNTVSDLSKDSSDPEDIMRTAVNSTVYGAFSRAVAEKPALARALLDLEPRAVQTLRVRLAVAQTKNDSAQVRTLQKELADAIEYNKPVETAPDILARQMSVVQKLVAMDDKTLQSQILDNPVLALSAQEKQSIRADVAITRDLRKLNPQARVFSGRNGVAIATIIDDPVFQNLVERTSIASSAISAKNAVLAADYLTNAGAAKVAEFYTASFAAEAAEQRANPKYVPLSPQEIGSISTAVKSVAEKSPSAFADRVQFERAVIDELSGTGTTVQRAIVMATRVGLINDVDQLAQLRVDTVTANPASPNQRESDVRAVARYLFDSYKTAYEGRIPSSFRSQPISRDEIQAWVSGNVNTPRAKAFFKLAAVAPVWRELSGQDAAATSLFGKTLVTLRGNDEVAVTTRLAKVVKQGTRPEAVTNLARGLVALANNAERSEELAGLAVDQARLEIAAALVANGVSQADAQEAAGLYNQQVGGIDLSADQMGLEIKRDGKGVVLPIADQDLENLRIDGLAPVILDVQPATPASVPFLMNLATGGQSK